MKKEQQLNEQLADILVKIDKTKRELKALPRGKPRPSFITSKERMIEVEETTKQLDILKQREYEIRAKIHSDNQ